VGGGWSRADLDTGVAISPYERAGEVPVGSFQLDEPTAAAARRRAGLVG
jgi:hypothetical protein